MNWQLFKYGSMPRRRYNILLEVSA